jgi:hypothetical protein
MGPWLKLGLALAGSTVAAVTLAQVRWARHSARAAAQLGQGVPGAPRVSDAQLQGLPAPVQRYLRFALPPGQPLIRRARVQQEGTFLMRPGAWSPFTATQHFGAQAPGFVWDASIRMAPLLSVRVRDSYVDGEGEMFVQVAGLLTLVHQRGGREMAASTLQRWLAEAAWMPTALLPREGLAWSELDAQHARATLTDRGVSVSVDFEFGPGGEIAGISTERYRDVNGTPVLTPWQGRFWSYAQRHGVQVPLEGEVAWVLPEGPQPYWRGRIVDFQYELAR